MVQEGDIMISISLGERKIGKKPGETTVILDGKLETGSIFIIDLLRRLEETRGTSATTWIPSKRVREYLAIKNVVKVINDKGDCILSSKSKKGKTLVNNPATFLKVRIQRKLKEAQNARD
jgi:hypothetical protein